MSTARKQLFPKDNMNTSRRLFLIALCALGFGMFPSNAPHPEFDAFPSLGSLQGSWRSPMNAYRLENPFLVPQTFTGTKHRGVDLVPIGRGEESLIPIVAPTFGVVSFRGVVVNRPVLTIDHLNGLKSSFEPVESALLVGDVVQKGEPVGFLKTPDQYEHCFVTCLHFGVRLNDKYVNPMLLIGGLKPSILLPAPSPIYLD